MYLAASFTHHDHDYVERRGGHALLSHMRTAGGRCAYRRAALERAANLYNAAQSTGATESEQAGLGLLAMQRALFAAEDLGGLIHALLGAPPSMQRLTSTTIPDLDAVFVAVRREPHTIRRAFLLPDADVMDNEDDLSAAERGAMLRLAQLVDQRRSIGLGTVSRFWLRFSKVAKATMHGFPFVSGELVLGPPPAGRLALGVRAPKRRPWTLAIPATRDREKAEIITTPWIIELDPVAVQLFVAAGRQATGLTEDLSVAQVTTIASGHGYTVPMHLKHRLTASERKLLDDLLARRQKRSDD